MSPDLASFSALGDSLQMEATVRNRNGHGIESPDVTGASDDTTVVRVDGAGIIRLARRGETKVTATASDSASASAVAVVLYTTASSSGVPAGGM